MSDSPLLDTYDVVHFVGHGAEDGRLERAGLVRRLASFWAVNPHPPVYRARADGEFNLGGQRLPFRKGEEIVWACPMM